LKIGTNFKNGTIFELEQISKWNKLQIGTNLEIGTNFKIEQLLN
jgi:hypothetical protein